MTFEELIAHPTKGGEEAIALAKIIYNYSQDCLMAHSIRAFQQHILEKYHAHYDIVILKRKGLFTITGKKSTLNFFSTGVFVLVDADEPHDQQRACIAHEIYHLILAAKYISGNDDDQHKLMKKLPSCREVEDICDVFANDLCTLHHKFYESDEAVKKGIFHNLPIYSLPKTSPKSYQVPL